VGVPGGNAGEFVLVVSTYEDMTGEVLIEDQIEKIFEAYLEKYGNFYFHTDGHTLEDAGIKTEDIDNPPDENTRERSQLLEKLSQPENIGCGHLKLAMKNSKEYGMRPELIQGMIKAFFKKLWSGNKNVEFVTLSGKHTEGAVVTILVEEKDINKETKIPTMTPSIGAEGTQTFVYHPQAVKFLRGEIAKGINDIIKSGAGREISIEDFAEAMQKKGEAQLNETVTRLANDDDGNPLPRFTVTYKDGKLLEDGIKRES
ncbi:MAG: hypothetical protein WCW16_00005, partial [Candidatus Magasanikbacteria bacterium]